MVFRSRFWFLFCLVTTFSVVEASAGLTDWFQAIWPKQPGPEDPHLYPEGSLLYDLWACKGETEIGWIGVTRQFTDHDPYVVVVIRSEFPEQSRLNLNIGMELHAPRHKMIIAADRVSLEREQDVAFFYHPDDMGRLGGYGEYKAVLLLDGLPRDVISFRLDREEDLMKKKEEERMRKEALSAFREGRMSSGANGSNGGNLEAKSLLGDPDSGPDVVKQGSGELLGKAQGTPEIVVRDPEDWYRTRYENEEGKIILFPKKARRTWQENVTSDLRHRIRYYSFL